MKKGIIAVIICAIVLSFSLNGNAAEITNERDYKPLDLVVVMDKSGSMLDSDKDRMTPEAIKLLMSLIPMEECRLGIVMFNTKAEMITIPGVQGLVNRDNFSAMESLSSAVDNVEYRGGTGIGNALLAATELLKNCSDNDHTKGILLFTDGVNDFGANLLELAACNDNESLALRWAKSEQCPIYCLGYDYLSNDGTNSMGDEGIARLQNISDNTGGLCERVHDISEARGIFERFLADIIGVHIFEPPGGPIPGDGGYHEREISVSSSVSELNISLVGDKNLSVEDAEIHLYDPSQAEVDLINTGAVRYYVGKSAINIKIAMPKAGKWLLTVKGVISDDMIHVNLLEHFKVNLACELEYPDGNPEGVAYSNDVIGIRVWLLSDGQELTDAALYDTVKTAEARCVSRANPEDTKVITLSRDGLSFAGSFTIPQDSYYDVNIRLEWDSFYRETTREIGSSNKPLYLVGGLDNVSVNKKKTAEISNIFLCVADDENDPITASVTSSSNPDAVDASVDADKLIIIGKDDWFGLWTSAVLTVTFRDAQGNTVPVELSVKCKNPFAIALLIAAILLIAVIVLLVIYIVYIQSHKLLGCAEITEITEGTVDKGGTFSPAGLSFKWRSTPVKTAKKDPVAPVFTVPGSVGRPPIPGGGVGGPPIPGGGVGGPPIPGGGVGGPPIPGGGVGGPPIPGGSVGGPPILGNAVPGGGGTAMTAEEAAVSAEYLKAVNFGGRRKHKLTVYELLESFRKQYSSFLTQRQIANAKSPEEVKKALSDLAPVTKKMYLLGSLQGKHGAVLRVRMKMVNGNKRKLHVDKPIIRGALTPIHYEKDDMESRTFSFFAVTYNTDTPAKGIRVTIYLHYANK